MNARFVINDARESYGWTTICVAGLTCCILAVGLVLGTQTRASAHAAEKNQPAVSLAQIAIALIRSQPNETGLIADKVKDTLESTVQNGVDHKLVQKAQAALSGGDLSKTEFLLERAIGSCPGTVIDEPGPIRSPQPILSPCPSPLHLLTLPRRHVDGSAEFVLLGMAALFAAAGAAFVLRSR